MVGRIIIGCLLFSLNVAGQEQNTVDSICRQDSTNTLMAKLRLVQHILDTRAKKKVDPAYIEVPDKPWRVIMRYKENVVDVDFLQDVDMPESNEHSDVRFCFEPRRLSWLRIFHFPVGSQKCRTLLLHKFHGSKIWVQLPTKTIQYGRVTIYGYEL